MNDPNARRKPQDFTITNRCARAILLDQSSLRVFFGAEADSFSATIVRICRRAARGENLPLI
jgi:hypothetical protein